MQYQDYKKHELVEEKNNPDHNWSCAKKISINPVASTRDGN
jgi:hypothetical protein